MLDARKAEEAAPAAPDVIEDRRPWGKFRQYAFNQPCTVKIITVAPGGTLSLQRHEHRDELWVVLDPGVRVEANGQLGELDPGTEVFVPRGTVHRLSSDRGGRILEVAFGQFDEGDIERLEDVYDRG